MFRKVPYPVGRASRWQPQPIRETFGCPGASISITRAFPVQPIWNELLTHSGCGPLGHSGGYIGRIGLVRRHNRTMRSDRVFDALHTLRNRYMLCQLASKATRKFHKPNTRIQETMNEVLDRIASSERQTVLSEPEHFAEAQRRAA